MDVFVAGGTGTLGRPVVRALARAGHTVTALCTLQGERAGRRAAWHLVVILHLHDAKVAEAWIIADDLGLYRQLELDILTPEVMSAVRGE